MDTWGTEKASWSEEQRRGPKLVALQVPDEVPDQSNWQLVLVLSMCCDAQCHVAAIHCGDHGWIVSGPELQSKASAMAWHSYVGPVLPDEYVSYSRSDLQ